MPRSDRLNLSVPRQLKQYDKYGGRLMLRCFKYHFFDNEDIRLTRQRCEAFFADSNNFVGGVRSPSIIPAQPRVQLEKTSSLEELFD